MADNKITTEYIQFSKRITRWGIILVTCILIICLSMIAFLNTTPEIIATISHLYSAYITVIGITIGAYQGNSSLEKWTKARYNFSEALNNIEKNENNQDEFDNEEEQEEESLG